MGKTLILVAAAFAVVACAEAVPETDDAGTLVQPSGPYTICAPDLTEDEMQLASDIWGVAWSCDGQVDAHLVIEDLGPGIGGWGAPGCWKIIVCPRTWEEIPDLVDFAVAHEVGHALGFDHSDDHCDIMWPNPAWDVECIRQSASVM